MLTKLERTMTRKHFVLLAEEISLMPIMSERLAAAIAVGKAAMRSNDRFDLGKFLEACKV